MINKISIIFINIINKNDYNNYLGCSTRQSDPKSQYS